MPRALVAGCGYVGSALAAELRNQGHDVTCLGRSPKALSGIQSVIADLCDAQPLVLPSGLDVIVFSAAPDVRDNVSYKSLYVQGVRKLLEAAPDEARFVFTSSTAVYGQRDGSVVDEDSSTEPTDFRSEILLQAEGLVSARPRGRTLRLAGIYGPGRARILEAVRKGGARFVPGRILNLVHRDDAAGALAHLSFLEGGASLYVGVDQEPVESGRLCGWLAETLGVKGCIAESDDRRANRNKVCSSARLRESGYRFRFPTYREGFSSLIETLS